ncbi:MAG: hypothetical protein ACH350_05350 [Parachlamydiaceae bacterium]
MPDQERDQVDDSHLFDEIEYYGDPSIASYNGKVPKFLIFNYFFWPIWGIFTLYYFWNGSAGWMDRGYWHQLQIAANTTFPIENQNMLLQNQVQPEKEEEWGSSQRVLD